MGEMVATEHGIHLSKIVNYTLSKGRSTSFGCMVCHVGTARLKEFGIKGFSARPNVNTQSYEATGGEIISWPATQSTTYTDVNNNYTRLDTVWGESMKKDVKMFNIGGKSYSDAEFWYYVVSRMIELSGGNYFKHEMRYTTDSGGYCWCHTEQLGQSYIGYDGDGPVGFNVPSESNNPIESEGKKYYGKETGKQPAHMYVQCWKCHSLAPGRH
ncbi:MAG: hypothetical protein HY929_03395 [Euryarchaeota archaeon]|nr:hypothetical protein [Euryarchaeota archaeon]